MKPDSTHLKVFFMSFLKNPIVQGVVTVIVVVLALKYVAPKIPVVGPYISLT